MIENWLKPVDLNGIMGNIRLEDHHLGNGIKIFEKNIPVLNSAQIVIIGLDEVQSNIVRKELYRTSNFFEDLNIFDLGNIRNKDNSFIIPLLSELIMLGITPIIIGEKTYQFRAQLLAHREKKRSVGLSLVSKNLKILHTILAEFSDLSSDIFVKYFYGMGIQKHYTNPALVKELDKNSYEILRLGKMQQNIKEIEPFLRNSDVFCVDISSIRNAEAPAQINPTAGGLHLEEICKACHYAGLNQSINSFGIYGYNYSLDSDNITASTIAQMIWYFIEGYQFREKEPPSTSQGMLEFIVDYTIQDKPVTFYKSGYSGKWWVDIAFLRSNEEKEELLACSYKDYVAMCNNEISDHLLKLIKRKLG